MRFMDIVKGEKAKMAVSDTEPSTENETLVSEQGLTDKDVPAGMPLTNRLDKMTREQAVWAIKNGDAWITYLKVKGIDLSKHQPTTDFVSQWNRK